MKRQAFGFAAALLAAAFLAGSAGAQLGNDDCDRACLEGFVDRYLDALIDNEPSRLPFAEHARFTEDGQQLELGDGLWNTMKAKGSYRLFVTDVPAGQATFLGTIYEDHRDPNQQTAVLMALRLKVIDGQIHEAEQLLVRDEAAANVVESMGRPRPGLTAVVPRANRMSRRDMIATANQYFTGMQRNDGMGDYPFADDCDRIENGGRATNAPTPAGQQRPDPATATGYSGQWTCKEQFESGLLFFVNRIRDRRFVAVDEERGLVFSFAFFDHSGGESRRGVLPDGREVIAGPVQPWTWQIAEIFKVEDGLIHEIEAILQRSRYGMNSGWSTWEEGMSDLARDETM